MNELKPCPFCGGSAAIRMTGSGHFVECDSCMAKVGSIGYGFDLDDVATAAWNQRVNTAWTDTPGAWTDELIQGMTVFIEHGDNLEWLGDESAEVVFLADVLRMRDELTAQLAEAQQRIAELEQRAAWVPVEDGWSSFKDELWFQSSVDVSGNGEVLLFGADDVSVLLPDYVRLCRRQVQEGAEG